jgi:hypothetical protein
MLKSKHCHMHTYTCIYEKCLHNYTYTYIHNSYIGTQTIQHTKMTFYEWLFLLINLKCDWYHNIWYHNIRYHNTWYHNIWYHNIWYHNIWYHNIWYHNIWYHNIWYHNIWYHNDVLWMVISSNQPEMWMIPQYVYTCSNTHVHTGSNACTWSFERRPQRAVQRHREPWEL